MAWYNKTALAISAIGAINWGLATFGWDLVNKIFGSWPTVADVVYWIVALCGVWALVKVFK